MDSQVVGNVCWGGCEQVQGPKPHQPGLYAACPGTLQYCLPPLPDWDDVAHSPLPCSDGKWDPKVVHLGSAINRAVLCCSWSPDGTRFAVGTGAKLVCVCYFEEEHNWWVGKAIKHHQSSITALAWHPMHSGLLATCSTDQHVRLFSAYLKGSVPR